MEVSLEQAAVKYVAQLPSDVARCRAVLGQRAPEPHNTLDSSGIRLVNWNVQKRNSSRWWAGFEPVLRNNHLILLQEAAFSEQLLQHDNSRPFRSFAPGYATPRLLTGVVTISQTAPLAHCNLSALEPWLRTAKATGITEFGLSNSDQTLVVVNIHAINFAFGLADFEAQLDAVFKAVQGHRGPLVVSGDFNTWRGARSQALSHRTQSFGLDAVAYQQDHRLRIWGQHLDQIYVRDLAVVAASTEDEPSSDHNPMFVTLRL